MVGRTGAPVKSPCIKVCHTTPSNLCRVEKDICQGCGRTLYEIKMWTSFSDNVKLEVIESSERRKANINIVRGERDE